MVLCHTNSADSVVTGGDTVKWWGHSNPTLCKRTCLNFLHSQVVETQELWVRAFAALPALEPPGETSTNYLQAYLICHDCFKHFNCH